MAGYRFWEKKRPARDLKRRIVTPRGQAIKFTPANPNTRTVDAHVAKLRQGT